jgi:hypothetical protein
MNEKEIFKGWTSYQINWSPDSREILISGRKWYDLRSRPAVGPYPAVEAPENSPLVIELK